MSYLFKFGSWKFLEIFWSADFHWWDVFIVISVLVGRSRFCFLVLVFISVAFWGSGRGFLCGSGRGPGCLLVGGLWGPALPILKG